MGILITIVAILGLFYIYKRREENEDLLVLKLIGYYILGGFKFIFNSFPIPLGYIIYLFIPKSKVNSKSKKFATNFGLAMFFIGIFIPFIQSSIYTRTFKIPISAVNINEINFTDELNKIQNKFDIKNQLYVDSFDTFLDSDGNISYISGTLFDKSQTEPIAYYLQYHVSDNGKLLVNRQKVSNYIPLTTIEANNFFTKVDVINSYITDKPKGLQLLGPSSIKISTKDTLYTIDCNNNIEKLPPSDDFVEGIIISCKDIVNGDDINANNYTSTQILFILQ